MFNNPFPNAFGLDIGDLSIKVVQLRNVSHLYHSPSFNLVNARSTRLPHGLIVNGNLEEPERVRKYIEHLLRGKNKYKHIRTPWTVVCLPESQGFIKLIQIDKEADDIIDNDIFYSAKKHTPFDENEHYIDWQIIPNQLGKNGSTNILIGIIPKQTANLYTYLLESLGLGIIALEIEALSVARSMITAKKEYKEEARALLDLGATRSSLIIYDNNTIQFSTSVPYSGEVVTTTIAQKMHVPYKEAEALKIKYGLDYGNKKGKLWHIMTQTTDDLIDQIQKAFDFYYSHFPQANKITHITMCGGGSAMSRLDKIISLKLKVSAKPGKPWKNLHSRKNIPDNPQESLKYATAIGLALRAADNPFFKYDII